ncbi:protein KHNYN isoform 2-T2 [Aulostomus maculatus]
MAEPTWAEDKCSSCQRIAIQEEQKEVSYPVVLHCVFCGAKGLFMDCLMKSTSAYIMVGSPGYLLISGLAEPVVRAYSLITDLVERYKGTRSSETDDRGSVETLGSRRAFKTLVEKWEDRHILDLLVLPGSVKEVLLDLVRESGLGSHPKPEMTAGLREDVGDGWVKPNTFIHAPLGHSSIADQWVSEITAGSCATEFLPGTREMKDGPERQMKSPQEIGEEDLPEQGGTLGEDDQMQHLPVGNKEFWLLLKFFTAMGYTEDVVKRVLAQTGPKEASQILDLVQQEQDCCDRKQRELDRLGVDQIIQALNLSERNRPCESEHREEEETTAMAGVKGMTINREIQEAHEVHRDRAAGRWEGSAEETREAQDDDFVLGVLKKAAVSCGYKEQKVATVYSMLPDGSTHQLLLELQRDDSSKMESSGAVPGEMDDVVLVKAGPAEDEARKITKVPAQHSVQAGSSDIEVPNLMEPVAAPDLFLGIEGFSCSSASQHLLPPSKPQIHHQTTLSEIKGPPMSAYSSSQDHPFTNLHSDKQYPPSSKHHHPPQTEFPKPFNSTKPVFQASQAKKSNTSPTRARERRGFMPSSSVVVTGEQRFLEGLQMPFDLQLTSKPGNPKLRKIIIDGSNVAMSHGLGHFFSCRGIALAVQHFWDRGHTNISVLLPQWRQKNDHKTKEQHYLTELQKVGLLSYTPSREVQGKRISSYDDRLMLQLAQKTDGVIVTNDNLRDLLDESPVWRDIIKKRLLQYTFVGDHFMVPDDPLGRGGPHLDDFLCSEHRTPDPGNHSFAGVATVFPSSKSPRSQTEVLNFRDRTLGGDLDATGGGRWSKRRGRLMRPFMELQHRKHGAEGSGSERRPPEVTASLQEQLCQVFPGQENMVTLVLQSHPAESDINVLSDLLLKVEVDTDNTYFYV